MAIHTFYFGGLKGLSGNYTAVCIARWAPRWFTGRSYPRFFPSERLLRGYKAGAVSDEEYAIRFNEETLASLPPAKILFDELNSLGENVLLCCYEKTGAFCHRHLVSARLRELGIKCWELRPMEMEKRKAAAAQPPLFNLNPGLA